MTDTVTELSPDDPALFDILGAEPGFEQTAEPLTTVEIETLIDTYAPQLEGNERQQAIDSFAKMTPKNQRALLDRMATAYAAKRSALNTIEAALAFNHTASPDARQRRILQAWPQCLFKARGLWLWGVDKTTLIHNVKVGNQSCFNVSSHTPIPGLYFEAGMTFADFEKRLEKIPGGWSHEKLIAAPIVPDHQKVTLPCAEIGNNIVLDVEGPITHAVMWGKSAL